MAVNSTNPITLLEAAHRHLEEAGQNRGTTMGEQELETAIALVTLAIEQLERKAAQHDAPEKRA
jgi:hypothetical protein